MAEGRYAVDGLRRFCADYLATFGVRPGDALLVADTLVTSDARGVHSHGVASLVAYTEQLRRGGIRPGADVEVVRDRGATALLDGGAGMGQLAAVRGMELAIDKARQQGAGTVAVRNSHHFGAAAYYASMALRHGMIGLASSNAGVTMTVPGASGRIIGNNPLAVAVPAGSASPIVLDLAMSAAAGGKVVRLAEAGEDAPEGWIVDAEGRPSTDPRDFIDGGALLPFGAHKGFGLAVIVEALAGALPGAALTTDVKLWRSEPDAPSGVGHLFQAIDVEAFRPLDAFAGDVDTLVARLLTAGGGEGGAVYLPGSDPARRVREADLGGVRLPGAIVDLVADLARSVGLDLPEPLA